MSKTFTDFDDDYVGFFADSLAHVHPDRRFPATLPDGALDGLDAPTMLVTHEHDTVFPAGALEARASTLIPNLTETLRVPGARHMPPFDAAKLAGIVDPIVAFLEA
jgi:pimeloyl-ACP methyl ester carboxylesterase